MLDTPTWRANTDWGRLRRPLSALKVLGGCCGTDIRHLRAIRDAWPP